MGSLFRLFCAIPGLLAGRYERPARWWHRVVCGLYFFADETEPGGRAFGWWTLGTPVGWFKLAQAGRKMADPDGMTDSWGVKLCFDERYIALRWGGRYLFVPMPWCLRHVSSELLLSDCRAWAVQVKDGPHAGGWKFPAGSFDAAGGPSPPYRGAPMLVTYETKKGDVQTTLAVCTAVRRVTWRWAWLPVVRRVLVVLDVRFAEPVGDGPFGANVVGATLACDDWRTPIASLTAAVKRASAAHTWG